MNKKRIVTKIGDVFSVDIGNKKRKFFQYITNDMTQLNSSIIRAFKKEYDVEERVKLDEVVKGDIQFHAHCVLRAGLQRGLWEKVGKAPVSDIGNILFRGTSDYGDGVEVSDNWRIWEIGENFQNIGKLRGEQREAEIGIVVNPFDIIDRMKTGEYKFKYPEMA